MSPLQISFGLKRSKYKMNDTAENCYKAFNDVSEKIISRDLIQEFLAYNTYPTHTGWKLPKVVKSREGELITFAFQFKEQALFQTPLSRWLKLIETKCHKCYWFLKDR
jgi:hypothetical protein